MPRIKRWFPVSHDINADPEVWAMRHQIGEKSLSIWLEFLSIADRNEGELPGDLEELLRLVSGRCQAAKRTVRGVYDFALSRLWLASDSPLRVVKWAKYHRIEERKKVPSEPSEPSEPKYLKKDTKETPSFSEISISDFVESWNDSFRGKLPSVQLPLSESRKRKVAARLREHPSMDFWTAVFTNINTSAFLLGSGSGKGHEAWQCTMDFVVSNDTNCVKIFEGAYNHAKNRA